MSSAFLLWNFFNSVFPVGLQSLVYIDGVSSQVEIPGGRGKPSTLVEKDDGIDKVGISHEFLSSYFIFGNRVFSVHRLLTHSFVDSWMLGS